MRWGKARANWDIPIGGNTIAVLTISALSF